MAVPTGASRVEYTIHTGDDDPDLHVRFGFDLRPGQCAEILDGAAQAAADHIVSGVESEFPEARVRAIRVYIGSLDGDPWPEEEPEPDDDDEG